MAKSAKSDRQKVIDDIRRKQKSADRRHGWMILGVCIAIAVLLIGAAAYKPVKNWWDLREYAGQSLSEIGAPASACGKVTTKSAEGSGQHEPDGTQIEYPDAPPAFGAHWSSADAPAPMDRKFWTEDDRPELEALVHNLEHGFTIVWYDETIADDAEALTELEAVGKKFPGDTDFRNKFYAAPWTSEDGEPFPDGQHIAFTHWSKGGATAPEGKQVGVWQYCEEFSGEALAEYMKEYPYLDSPEPDAIAAGDSQPS